MQTCPKCNHKFTTQKGNKKYQKGVSYERIVKHKLEEKGYEVFRAYASRGVYDLIAKKGSITLGIQVKSLKQKNKQYLTPKDRTSLNKELAETQPYTLLKWDMKKRAVVEMKFGRPIHIVHAWKDGINTKWAHLINEDDWRPFKP